MGAWKESNKEANIKACLFSWRSLRYLVNMIFSLLNILVSTNAPTHA